MSRRVPCLSECYWYHTMDVPGIGTVEGEGWDLRQNVGAYLGGVAFAGKRVLEIGPASGFLTAEMERRGAAVLALEIDAEHEWDFVPNAAIDLDAVLPGRRRVMRQIKNAWHVTRAAFRLHAEIVYGHAEAPPADRGRFDLTVFGCVLLHCRNPLTVLERCAALTNDTIVVVERHFPELGDEPVARLAASVENQLWDTWWDFTPAFFERGLRLLGFSDVAVTYHEQPYRGTPLPLFTVVAGRA